MTEETEKATADFWRWVAMTACAGIIGVLTFAINKTQESNERVHAEQERSDQEIREILDKQAETDARLSVSQAQLTTMLQAMQRDMDRLEKNGVRDGR